MSAANGTRLLNAAVYDEPTARMAAFQITIARPVESPPEYRMAAHTQASTSAHTTVSKYGSPITIRTGRPTSRLKKDTPTGSSCCTTGRLSAVYNPQKSAAATIMRLPNSVPGARLIVEEPPATTTAVPKSEMPSAAQAAGVNRSVPNMTPNTAVHIGALAMISAAVPAAVAFTPMMKSTW